MFVTLVDSPCTIQLLACLHRLYAREAGQGLLEHNFKYQAENHAASLTKLSRETYPKFSIRPLGCSNCWSAYSYSPVTKMKLLAVSDVGSAGKQHGRFEKRGLYNYKL